jgi:hypothetical protein
VVGDWGTEFKRWLIAFLVITFFVYMVKLPMLQNIPVVGKLFQWWAGVFSEPTT